MRLAVKISLYIILIFTLSCNLLKHGDKVIPGQNIDGVWTEHWGKDTTETNVNYVDTLNIKMNKSGIKIQCINNHNYEYSNISFKDQKLNFTMRNGGTFYVYYYLTQQNHDLITGHIINSQNKMVNIRLVRFK
jgi:hypothetical protein